jgi:hypothetical protein
LTGEEITKMKARIVSFLLATLAALPCANAQVVPVGGTGQAIIARFYAGIDCTTAQPTGFGTAGLYFPFIAGIPAQFLFRQGATVQDETTATLTAVFSKGSLASTTNYNITNTFLAPIQVNYYYHPNTSPKDWTDFDGFQAGTLVATYSVQEEMFSTVNGVSWGIVSGPFIFSGDFALPDGTIANLQRLMPGGITVTTVTSLATYVSATPGGAPQVVNLTTSKGPFTLGSCAVMIPFSGPGFNPGGGNARSLGVAFDKPGEASLARPAEDPK